jgi:hypothetical protein
MNLYSFLIRPSWNGQNSLATDLWQLTTACVLLDRNDGLMPCHNGRGCLESCAGEGKTFTWILMSATLVHWCWPTTHPSSSRHHCLSSLDDSKGQSCMTAVPTLLERHCMESVVSVEGVCIGARGIDYACIRVEERIGLSVCRRSSEKGQDGSSLFYRMCPPIRVSFIHSPCLLSFLSQLVLITVSLSLLWSSSKPVKGSLKPLLSHWWCMGKKEASQSKPFSHSTIGT